MLAYALRRLLAMVPVVVILSVVVFLIVYLTPGDPASTLLGMEASAEDIAAADAQENAGKTTSTSTDDAGDASTASTE